MPAVIAIALFGTLIGSFLNVVIYRVPQGLSVVSPASACGHCGHPIRSYDNIPIVSWLLLRGKCRDCGGGISIRYPLVELAGGVLFTAVALRFVPELLAATSVAGSATGTIVFAAYLYFVAISLALTAIDLDTGRLPNALVLPAYPVAVIAFAAASLATGDFSGLVRALAGGAALFVFYLVIALVKPGGMGMGDVKLAGVIGLFLGWLGWDVLAVGAIVTFLLGGLFGVALLALRRARTTAIPFGPWMLGGAWVGILAGGSLARSYLELFGIGVS